jgi:hypothetical protein
VIGLGGPTTADPLMVLAISTAEPFALVQFLSYVATCRGDGVPDGGGDGGDPAGGLAVTVIGDVTGGGGGLAVTVIRGGRRRRGWWIGRHKWGTWSEEAEAVISYRC